MFDARLNERPARVEWLLIGGLLGLIIMGTASVYSATMGNVSMTGKQIIWYLAGIGAGAIFCFIPYHNLTRWALVAYWVTILLLIAVLVPGIGSSKSGARRWIEAGSFQFQPSEFAKLAFIFVQAQFLSRPLEELRSPGIFAKALGMTVLPFVLILKEPDLGSALGVASGRARPDVCGGDPPEVSASGPRRRGNSDCLAFGGHSFRATKLANQIGRLPAASSAGLFRSGFCSARCHSGTTEARSRTPGAKILSNAPSADYRRHGRVDGQGLASKGRKRPSVICRGGAAHNDFIFSVIAEENGFVGSVIVLTLYTDGSVQRDQNCRTGA